MKELKKNYQYDNGYLIDVDVKSDVLRNGSDEILDNLFGQFPYTTNINALMYIISALTKGSKESKKQLTIINNGVIEALAIVNGDTLNSYYSERSKDGQKLYETKYSAETGYNFRVFDSKNAQDIVEKEVATVKNLSKQFIFPMTNLEKVIISIYKTVFDEDPDFSKAECRCKCTYLICILNLLGMPIDNQIHFDIYKEYIASDELTQIFSKLAPFGSLTSDLSLSEILLKQLTIIAPFLNIDPKRLSEFVMAICKQRYIGVTPNEEDNNLLCQVESALGR